MRAIKKLLLVQHDEILRGNGEADYISNDGRTENDQMPSFSSFIIPTMRNQSPNIEYQTIIHKKQPYGQ